MRSFRVQITTDLEQYKEWTKGFATVLSLCPGTKGLYFNGCIWISTLRPLTLGHEFIHHLIGHSAEPFFISPRLFSDFLNVLWDVIYYRLTNFRTSKERDREAIRRLKTSLNDWLDWILCREPIE